MKIAQQEVELKDHYGTDLSIVNAARVSFAKESRGLDSRDSRLIEYLARHNHWTPFGHAGATFRVKAPIFVARQLGKHQVGFVWNEVSRRYVDEEPEFYFPAYWRARAANVKQGSSESEVIEFATFCYYKEDPTQTYEATTYNAASYAVAVALETYKAFLSAGVAPEQARMVLPQNTMTEWWWTGSLAAWARVAKLRLDPHAQKETRDVVQMISNEMEKLFPVSWPALL